jgi:hypothetical protein
MGPRLRSLGAKLAFAVLAALISVPLAAWTDGLLLHQGLVSPGMYVWRLSHPHPQPGFLAPLGSGLGTMMIIDSSCWFILLCLAGFMIVREGRRRRRDRIDTPPSK